MLELAADIVERAQSKGATVAECSVQRGRASLRQGAARRARAGRGGRLTRARPARDARPEGRGHLHQRSHRVGSDAPRRGRRRAGRARASPIPSRARPIPRSCPAASEHVELELFDPAVDGVDGAEAVRRAREGERAALELDPRITNSEGATFTRVSGGSALVTSGGFRGVTRGTYASIVVSPVADDEDGKKRSGYYWSSRRFLSRARGRGRRRSRGRAPHAAQARRAQGRVARGAGHLRSRRRALHPGPGRELRQRRRHLAQVAATCSIGWRHRSPASSSPSSTTRSFRAAPARAPTTARGCSRAATSSSSAACSRATSSTPTRRKKLNMPSTANASRGSSGGVGISSTNFQLAAGHDLARGDPRRARSAGSTSPA